MKKIGAEIYMEIIKHGFYPKGGGRVKVTFNPMEELKPLNLTERGKLLGIDVRSIASENLKKARVAERQVEGLKKSLKMDLGNVFVTYVNTFSPGSSLNAHAHFENCKIGAVSLGKRGKPAEKVGEEVAGELKRSIESNATLDKHMADQILPFLALAKGKSVVTVEKITEHCLTNIYVIEKILPVKFEVKGEKGEFGEISVRV